MGKGSSGTNTVTQNSAPPPEVMANYNSVMNQANNVASTPYSPYSGSLIAGFTPEQQNAFANVDTASGLAQPYIGAAADLISASTSGINPAATIGMYMDPYQQDVTNATETAFNNQNAIQSANLTGNAVSQGAYGGDREAVAQATLAGQQQANEAPVLAQIQEQGFNTALQTGLQTQQANAELNSQGAAQLGALGSESQTMAMNGADAQMQVGSAEQALAQQELTIPYQAYQAAQAYPYQNTAWLQSMATGLGSQMGGTGSTTSPGPSIGSELLGTGLAGVGLYNALGGSSALSGLGSAGSSYVSPGLAAFETYGLNTAGTGAAATGAGMFGMLGSAARGGAIKDHYDLGGAIDLPTNAAPDLSVSYVPNTAITGPRQSSIPHAPQAAQQRDPMQDDLQLLQAGKAIAGFGKSLRGPPENVTAGNDGTFALGGFVEPMHSADALALKPAGQLVGGIAGGIWGGPLGAMAGSQGGGQSIMAAGDALAGRGQAVGWDVSGNLPPGFQAPGNYGMENAATGLPLANIGRMIARGGPVHREDGGGVSPMLAAGMGSGNPMVSGMLQRYAGLPTEQLREMGVAYPPNSQQGQMVQALLRRREMQPQAGVGQASTPAAQAQPTSGMARGGYLPPVAGFAVRRDDGGAVDPAEVAKPAAPGAGLEPGDRNEEAPPASDLPSGKILPLPTPGEVQEGMRFAGGDPGDPKNWQPAGVGPAANTGAEQGRDASDVLAGLRAAPDGPVEQAPIVEPGADQPQQMRPLSGTPQIVAQTARTLGVDPVHALVVAQIESGMGGPDTPGNPNTGLFQLGPVERAKYGKGDGSIASEAALGVRSLVDDQQIADAAVGGHAEGWQAYVVHQQGIGGGQALLRANPNDDAATVLVNNTQEWRQKGYGAALEELRGNIPQDMRAKVGPAPTVGQFLGIWRDKYASIRRQFTGAAMSADVPASVMDQAGGSPRPDQAAGFGNKPPPDTVDEGDWSDVLPQPQHQRPALEHGGDHHDDFYDRLSGPSGALLMAGLGMMAGKSKFPLVNIGEGGQAGLNWAEHQAQIREQQQMREVQADYNNVYREGVLGNQAQRNTIYGDIGAGRNANAANRNDITQQLGTDKNQNTANRNDITQQLGTDRNNIARQAEQDRAAAAQRAGQMAEQRLQSTQTYQAALLALRRQGMDEASARVRLSSAVSGAKAILTADALNGRPVDYDGALKQSLGSNDKVTPQAQPQTVPRAGGAARPQSKADYDALPAGTPYIDPNGVNRIKGGG